MNLCARLAAFACTALFFGFSPTAARAVPIPPETFTFAGTCLDCTPGGYATLVLQGAYTPGSAIQLGDFVSFTYQPTSRFPGFSIDHDTLANAGFHYLSGNMPAVSPGHAEFWLEYGANATPVDFVFRSSPDGSWCAGGTFACGADYGVNGSWSEVPEPGVLGLAGLGSVMAVVVARTTRRRRRAAA